ncbi:quercetin 3-O-methyltransferase 1-like [Arachis ipaensis]|uniref:quercetin 3-O-methyltransferase 1-like n=1 Tax=Arachis ipaensis TaxID=130454 RepID=UPI000A2B0503|nr:quercetin 3-O-methyltransferase 1-like [Arachis ipaensis]
MALYICNFFTLTLWSILYISTESSCDDSSKYFVTDADDGSLLGPTLALLLDNVFYQSWKEVKGAIMEGGIPFNKVYGMHAFEYPGVDQRFNEVFNKAMNFLLTSKSEDADMKLIDFSLSDFIRTGDNYSDSQFFFFVLLAKQSLIPLLY